jgi:predicted nuclease of restriction endonuclease-like (RecB) superfamily
MKKEAGKQVAKTNNKSIFGDLIGDIRSLIETARHNVAVTVNAGLTILYWQIGSRIRRDILKEKRADYGKEIVATLSRQLSWSHFKEILPLKKPLQHDFYGEMCRIERWSVRTLRKKIDGMLYERTAISKKPEELVKKELAALREEDRLTPDLVFRDPYFLDFLGLKDTFSEKDLESSILREMESFILELGIGFSFVARQKRITVDNEDYYLDLLFFHRKLKRLIAIELKLGKFKAAFKGQMELYLRWLEKYEKEPGEETPLGLILCAGAEASQSI